MQDKIFVKPNYMIKSKIKVKRPLFDDGLPLSFREKHKGSVKSRERNSGAMSGTFNGQWTMSEYSRHHATDSSYRIQEDTNAESFACSPFSRQDKKFSVSNTKMYQSQTTRATENVSNFILDTSKCGAFVKQLDLNKTEGLPSSKAQ